MYDIHGEGRGRERGTSNCWPKLGKLKYTRYLSHIHAVQYYKSMRVRDWMIHTIVWIDLTYRILRENEPYTKKDRLCHPIYVKLKNRTTELMMVTVGLMAIWLTLGSGALSMVLEMLSFLSWVLATIGAFTVCAFQLKYILTKKIKILHIWQKLSVLPSCVNTIIFLD